MDELDNIKVGDILFNGTERMVLGLNGNVVFMSATDNVNVFGVSYTKQELLGYGYELKKPQPLIIEIGKFYKTRNGDKALALIMNKDSICGPYNKINIYSFNRQQNYSVSVNGEFCQDRNTDIDLISLHHNQNFEDE